MDPALLLVAGLAVILLLQFSRIRRQQREVRATQSAVAVGAEVLTAAVVRVLGPDDPASASYVPPATTTTTDGAATENGTDAGTALGTDADNGPTTGTGRPDAVDGDGTPRTQD